MRSRVQPTPGPTLVPPIPEAPITVPILGAPQPVPPTTHRTTFNGCSFGIFVVLDDDQVCIGYRFVIQDPREAHMYEANFDQNLVDEWTKMFNSFPRVGEKVDESE